MGIKQVVETASGVEIEANGKIKAGSCSMCKGPHKVTACTRRSALKMGAAEYILSMDEQHRFTEGRLRTYMNNSMPYSLPEEGQEDVSYFHHVDAGSLRSNVIIHEARNVGHAVIYSVSFLDEYAQPAHGSCWISKEVMNSVITHNKKML
eukprot:5116418-Prorocentrum_lima.AAC.1